MILILLILLILLTLIIKQRKCIFGGSNLISNIYRHGNPSEVGRLLSLIKKFIPSKVNLYDSDEKILSHQPKDLAWLGDRIDVHANIISNILSDLKFSSKPSMLDIGCGNGKITKAIGNKLNFSKIVGVDVFKDKDIEIEHHFNLAHMRDKQFDLILCNMSLHHFEKIDALRITKLLKPNGYLFIREHDCWSKIDKDLIQLEHILYKDGEQGEFTLYNLHNMEEWKKIFSELTLIRQDFYYTRERKEITPTRAYWALFKKL